MKNIDTETIIALATPMGKGAIGVIRISGKHAFQITDQILKNKKISEANPNTIHYAHIYDSSKDEYIDEVLVSVMKEPHTYTGENTVEISCHNNRIIIDKIISLACLKGARIAQPGEFTQRAFLNGKLDLSQAEAVQDIIISDSRLAEKLAMNQLMGSVTTVVGKWSNEILDILSNLEIAIDHEGISEIDTNDLIKKIENLIREMESSCIHSTKMAELNNGLQIVIAGQPNVGKSSLLNKLIQQEKAIISDMPGTTRDPIEVHLMINGVKVTFIDTAGLRDVESSTKNSHEHIELIGIQKTKEYLDRAYFVLYMVDASQNLADYDKEMVNALKNKKVIIVANKCDKGKKISQKDFGKFDCYEVSALKGENIHKLIDFFGKNIEHDIEENSKEGLLVNARHQALVRKAKEFLDKATISIKQEDTVEIIALELRDALTCLNEIRGIDISEEVLDRIFSNFCVGK